MPLIQASNNASFPLSQQFLITEVEATDGTISGSSIFNTSSVEAWKSAYFNYLNDIALTSTYGSTAPFSYYSVE
jgi:hypothetical protein